VFFILADIKIQIVWMGMDSLILLLAYGIGV
jgi:hypothetical protein